MKLRVPCVDCLGLKSRTELPASAEEVLCNIEIRNDDTYDATCPRGHNTRVYINNPKYELLFDIGALALLDGYPREAVTSMAASFERFLEFYVRCICESRGINPYVVDCTMKYMSKQSERQLGAALIIFAIDSDDIPFFYDENRIAFRNKVVHQGMIPTKEEVIGYADYIRSVVGKLMSKFSPHYEIPAKVAQYHSSSRIPGTGDGRSEVTCTTKSILRCNLPTNFTQDLESLEKLRDFYFAK